GGTVMTNLAEDILNAVNGELNNLGDNAPPEAVEEIVLRHAKTGAGDNPALQQEAMELARQQLENGMAPDAAAVSAATQTYQKGVSQRPGLQANGDELRGYLPGDDGIPGSGEVDEYLKNHGDAKMTSEQREVLSEATTAFKDAGMDDDLAAQAQ